MLSTLRCRLPLLLLASSPFRIVTPVTCALSPASVMSTAASALRNPKSRVFSTGPPASTEGLDLYSVRTPNGLKINVALEELRALGTPVKYTEHTLDFSKNEQKEDWYVREINPNGRIPAIVDRSRNDQRVFETGSIILYLAKHYDTGYKLHFAEDADETEMLSWIFFQHGGIGPMQGQAGHFLNAAPEKIPYAAKRYIDETKRLLGVYEERLQSEGGRDFLVGPGKGKFSYADIVSFTWIRSHPLSLGLPSLTTAGFPALDAWVSRISTRPGTAKALEGNGIDKLKAEDKVKWVWVGDEAGQGRQRDEL